MTSRILRTLVLLGCTAICRGADPPAVLLDDGFVEPPQQHAAWTCPKGVPEKLEQAANKLFALGYADSRGLEYKSATVFVDPWTPVSVHAWLFTGANGRRYAVAWNGMVYGVETEGEPADLGRDMAAVIEQDDLTLAKEHADHLKKVEAWEKANKESYPFPPPAWSRNFPPVYGYSHEKLRFNMPLMLLRMGRTDLAVKLWTRWFDADEEYSKIKASDLLVGDWLNAWKDRAGHAHAMRDDRLALLSLRLIEKTLQTAGWSRSRGVRDNFGHEELLADHERRLRARDVKGTPVGDWDSVMKLPVEQRATEWLRWLDDSDKETISKIERHVLELGAVALESVLAEFVRDQRLARVPHEYMHGSQWPHSLDFIPVWEILRNLASKLAGLPSGTLSAKEWAMQKAEMAETDVRKGLAVFFRQEAAKNKNLSLADIAWRQLNDNDDPVLWAPAAVTLCRGLNSFSGGDPEPQTQMTREEVESLKGYVFGAKYSQQTKPSVGELLLQRAEELDKKEMRQQAAEIRRAKTEWDAGTK